MIICPKCNSDNFILITPYIPGPTGWGYRCKSCNHTWELPLHQEEKVMYELWVKRAGEWHIIGQYSTRKQAEIIRDDYVNRGEIAEVRHA
jgi:transposase-like protein